MKMKILGEKYVILLHSQLMTYVSSEFFYRCQNCEHFKVYVSFPKCSEMHYKFCCSKFVEDTVPCKYFKLINPFSEEYKI